MRNTVIGIVIGVVVGVVVGATLIAPRLIPEGGGVTVLGKANPDGITETTAALPLAASITGRMALRWTMVSAYGPNRPQFGDVAKRIDSEIWRVSGGATEIKLQDAAELELDSGLIDAVASGTLAAALLGPDELGAKSPALELVSAMPFGPPARAHLAWLRFGGGLKAATTVMQKLHIKGLPCGLIGSEGGGWFRDRLRTPEDLQDLRIRLTGFGGRVIEKLGAKALATAPDQVFADLESRDLDAVIHSVPSNDAALDFHKFARFYYLPGWQRPVTVVYLVINLDKWRALSATRKAQIEAVCGRNIELSLAESEHAQFEALKLLTKNGVNLDRWPSGIVRDLREAWQNTTAEIAAVDPDFKKTWQSVVDFRKEFSIWEELGLL